MDDQTARDDFFEGIRKVRKSVSNRGDGGSLDINDSEAYPHLVRLLTELPKGAVKGSKFGRVSFWVQGGRLTACVTIPSTLTVGYITLDGFQDAFTALHNAIDSGKVDWREDKPWTPQKRS